MTNENTVTLFPCRDAVSDGCPNTTVAPDTYCCDCHLFYEEIAESQKLLNDESWKSPAESIATVDAALAPLVAGFEVVEFKGDVDNLPVIVHAEESDLVIADETPKPHPDLETTCYTMNAAEVDCQAALYEIVSVLAKYQDTLKQIDAALSTYEVR